ncbi:MAG: TrmB family transcriptional regulator [Thermoprotei archaeon]|nr:MAG: TrmB family transcriptional regulator [Thermoprotei archaeon]
MVQGVKKKILELLQVEKNEEFSLEEIAERIGEQRISIIKAQLTRLIREGKVVEVRKGVYKAL